MECLRQEGLIGAIGLSSVDLDQYRTADTLIHVVCVELLQLGGYLREELFAACRTDGVAFVPFFPLGLAFNPETLRLAQLRSGLRRIDSVQHRLKSRCLVAQPGSDRIAYSWNLVTRTFGREPVLRQIWSSTKRRVKHSRSGKGGASWHLHLASTMSGITVADLDLVTAFFVTLGLEVEGRTVVEGDSWTL